MRTQHGRDIEIVGRVLAALQDGDDVKGVSVLVEEAFGRAEVRCDLLGVLAGEHEKFEAGIRGREVLDVHLARVRGAHERVREQALADDKVRRYVLMGRLDDHGRRILDADAGREVAVFLESSRLRIGISYIVRSVVGEASEPDEFLVGWTVPFAIYAKPLGEQGREPLVKGNQVLSVFPALKFVLGPRISQRGS